MPRKRNNSDGSRLFDSEVCAFCGRNEDNELLYGKFIISEDLTLHNNCMFFASGLSQTGENETDGFSGFLPSDIEAELRRGKKLLCSYCRKRGATIGCCEAKCKKSFHLPCGIEHGSLHQFFGSFSSFCKAHAPKQKVVDIPDDLICHICCDVIADNLEDCLYSPCCKNSWFHKICLQKYALSAGLYFFKCPLCNNSKEFVKEMEMHGICIPDKDAAWELEENAFQDLLTKPECDAPTCFCSKGRTYCPKKKSGWTLLPCSYCGYHARHKNCENIKSSTNSWICSECKTLEEEILKSKVMPEAAVKNELSTKDSLAENNQSKIPVSTVSCLPSSSSPFPSSSCVINFYNEQKASPTKRNICYNVDPLHIIVSTSTYVKHSSDDIQPESIEESLFKKKLSSSKIELDSDSYIRKSTIVQDKQIVNFKDIKNLSHNSVPVRKIGFKAPSVKKVAKKRKLDTSCNSPDHYCIRKYFGQECGKFRI